MIVADNGSNWFISGATDSRWNDDDLNQMKTVPGSAFEVVDTGPSSTDYGRDRYRISRERRRSASTLPPVWHAGSRRPRATRTRRA